MSGFIKLSGGTESSGARTDDRDFLARAFGGGFGDDPALRPAFIDDRVFDTFNGHWRVVNAQYAGAFAGCWADSTREFGEIVGFVKSVEGFAPESTIDQIVPFGNQVINRAAASHATNQRSGMAEGRTTVHASSSLIAELVIGHGQVKFVPIVNAIEWCDFAFDFAQVFNKSGWLAHRGRILTNNR
jgi:hypothetical protein